MNKTSKVLVAGLVVSAAALSAGCKTARSAGDGLPPPSMLGFDDSRGGSSRLASGRAVGLRLPSTAPRSDVEPAQFVEGQPIEEGAVEAGEEMVDEGAAVEGGVPAGPVRAFGRAVAGLGRPVASHSAKRQESLLAKSMGIFTGHGSDRRTRDIGYNNPCFPRELRMASHPMYVVEPPDVLYVEALQLLPNRPVAGERLVRQDGTISLGYYGQIHVAGLTLAEIEEKIRQQLSEYVLEPQVYVDVAAFNSKVYYVLGQVQQTGRLPITGKETVLDGLTLAGGPTNFARMRDIHVARPNPGGGCDQILHVDYRAIVDCGDTRTNYQLLPGDRIFVPGTRGFMTNVFFDNFLTPVERLASLFAFLRLSQNRN